MCSAPSTAKLFINHLQHFIRHLELISALGNNTNIDTSVSGTPPKPENFAKKHSHLEPKWLRSTTTFCVAACHDSSSVIGFGVLHAQAITFSVKNIAAMTACLCALRRTCTKALFLCHPLVTLTYVPGTHGGDDRHFSNESGSLESQYEELLKNALRLRRSNAHSAITALCGAVLALSGTGAMVQ